MPVQFRGRNTTSDLFKPGERCHLAGVYGCETCRLAERETVVQVEVEAIFPLCAECPDLDMGWRLRDAARA
jgi:hypothetical protein